MADSDRFPIPATGSIIPKGWFARLVAFINSLVVQGDGRYTLVNRSAAGTSVTLTPSLINALNRSAAPSAGGGGSTAFVPDYSSPTAITRDTQYGPLAYPVWIIGSIGAVLYTSSFEVYLSIGNLYSFTLYKVSQGATDPGFQISYLANPVSVLIPANTAFTIHTITTSPSDLDVDLNYFPCL